MRAITSGVFFQRRPPPAHLAYPIERHVPRQQLPAALRHRPGVEAEEVGHASVAAVPEFEGFQARIEPTLALVEQRAEENDRRLEIVGHATDRRAEGPSRRRHVPHAAGPNLLLPPRLVRGEMHEAARHFFADDAPVAGQFTQRIFDADVQHVLEFVGRVPRLRIGDEDLRGPEECLVLRKPDRPARPQPQRIEPDSLLERVVLAAMRVAGMVGELAQFPKDRDIHVGAEGRLEFGHRRDRLRAQQDP